MDLHPIPTISLFTGSGMLDIAIEFALERFGVRAVPLAYIERDSAAAAVILAWMEAKALGEAPICDSLESFDGRIFRPYMAGGILLASPPCQPYSSAGKRAGNDDHRSHGEDGNGPLVHLIRIIGEVRPAVVFFENVCEWVTGGAFQRFGDELSNLGYVIEEPFFLAAEDVGAPHERERVFIMAQAGLQHLKLFQRAHGSEYSGVRGAMADAGCERSPDWRAWAAIAAVDAALLPRVESAVPVVVDGMVRADELRIGGNGVCPLAAGYAFHVLMDRVLRRGGKIA